MLPVLGLTLVARLCGERYERPPAEGITRKCLPGGKPADSTRTPLSGDGQPRCPRL